MSATCLPSTCLRSTKLTRRRFIYVTVMVIQFSNLVLLEFFLEHAAFCLLQPNKVTEGFLIRKRKETHDSLGTNDQDRAGDCYSLIQIENAEQPLGESKERDERNDTSLETPDVLVQMNVIVSNAIRTNNRNTQNIFLLGTVSL